MICNKAELSDILGVSQVTLTAWQKEGLPFGHKRGKENAYDTAKVIKWLMDRERLKQSAAIAAKGGIDIEHEKARKERALADKHELDLQVRRGELLEVNDVEKTWLTNIRNAVNRILGVPSKVAPLLVTMDNPKEAEQIIVRELREALEVLGE